MSGCKGAEICWNGSICDPGGNILTNLCQLIGEIVLPTTTVVGALPPSVTSI